MPSYEHKWQQNTSWAYATKFLVSAKNYAKKLYSLANLSKTVMCVGFLDKFIAEFDSTFQ